ncbi:MAG: hypothetical protein AB7Y46_13855 [Armatimonadota bacterium]
MATSHSGVQDGTHVRTLRRRWLFLGVLAFAAVAWGPRALMMLAEGWSASAQVLAREQEIQRTRERVAALRREAEYAASAEGKDLEAKRRFGVGPQDEIWIAVEAEPPPRQSSAPVGVGERVEAWLTNAGSSFMDRCRRIWAVGRYWLGLDDVGDCLPTVVEEEPAPADDAAPAAGGERLGDDGSAQQ